MRMIDLDQKIIVPIIDEKIGTSYEMEMTVAEMFDKFCEGLQPEVTEAVPVEWLKKQAETVHYAEPHFAFVYVLQEWEKTKSIEELQAESEMRDWKKEVQDGTVYTD